MTTKIVKAERVERLVAGDWSTYGEAGELLTMSDGSVWFHPYNGRAPRCERQAEAA